MGQNDTREDHLAWCKERALEYVDRGDLVNAVASMVSDLGKHRETKSLVELGGLGVMEAASGDTNRVRKFIEGFN